MGEAKTPFEENAESKHATRSYTHTYHEVLHYGISFSWSCLADSPLNPVGVFLSVHTPYQGQSGILTLHTPQVNRLAGRNAVL